MTPFFWCDDAESIAIQRVRLRVKQQMRITSTHAARPSPQIHHRRESPGLLIGLNQPPSALANAARKTLNLPEAPKHLLLGIQPQKAIASEVDQAIVRSGVAAAKLLSKSLAGLPNAPQVLKQGVDVFWYGVDIYETISGWRDTERDVPALMVKTAGTLLSGCRLGTNMTGIGNECFEHVGDTLEAVVTTADALANNRDVAIAHLNDKVVASEIGQIAAAVSPVLNAMAKQSSTDGQVEFSPLPQWVASAVTKKHALVDQRAA
ncbi:MAG: hypothetical protein AAF989_01555 [Planctomycetota bacterium]